tara:strand:- start:160 stop:558 length:399 start_codon:yes stop_codon:yes gene_type:complete
MYIYSNINYDYINYDYVDQSEIKISKKELRTDNVGTCSVLLFSLNNINFLAHIDAIYTTETILLNKIKKNFQINDLKKINIYIIPGEWCDNCYTINLIKNVLKKLNLSKYKIINGLKWKNSIILNNNLIKII